MHDIRRLQPADGEHRRMGRIDAAGDQGLQAHHQVGGHHHRVHRLVRPGRMAAATVDANAKRVGIGADYALVHREHAHGVMDVDVAGEAQGRKSGGPVFIRLVML